MKPLLKADLSAATAILELLLLRATELAAAISVSGQLPAVAVVLASPLKEPRPSGNASSASPSAMGLSGYCVLGLLVPLLKGTEEINRD